MSKFIVKYAISRTSNDRWPITFRPDCERTPCDWKGESEGLLEVIQRLNRCGYDLVDRTELLRILEARNG